MQTELQKNCQPWGQWHCTVWENPDIQPKELTEGKLININGESGCDRKDEFASEKEFQNTESTKDKMLDVEPNLENSMTICQGIKKMLPLVL